MRHWFCINAIYAQISQTLCLIVKRPIDQQKIDRKKERRPTLRKFKRATMQPPQPTQIVVHLILPNNDQSPTDHWTADILSVIFTLTGIKIQTLRMKTEVANAQ